MNGTIWSLVDLIKEAGGGIPPEVVYLNEGDVIDREQQEEKD